MKQLKLSHSKINTWRKCHKCYHYKYVLDLVKKKKGSALQRGGAIHECIEAFHNGKSWHKPYQKFKEEFFKNTFVEEREVIGDLPELVKTLMENYAQWIEEKDDLTYLMQEQEFLLPLTIVEDDKGQKVEVLMNGYIDSVVESNNKVYAMERKTYAKEPNRDFLVFNNQSGIYTWALQQLKLSQSPPSGTLWEIIKAKMPSKPKLTQKGVLSKAQLDSTPLTVRRGLKELGLDPNKYDDFLKSFDYEGFFVRSLVLTNDSVVNSIMQDCRDTAQEIALRGPKAQDRNMNRDCSFCDYKELCQAELMGLDTNYIIKAEYQKKEESNGRKEKEKTQPKPSNNQGQ